jgi:hypothetical protein
MIEYNQKCEMLAELWTNYKNDKNFEDFFEYNDLGLPLAFAISNNIVESTPIAKTYIIETFDLLCEALGLDTDDEFESLDDMFELQAENEEDDV